MATLHDPSLERRFVADGFVVVPAPGADVVHQLSATLTTLAGAFSGPDRVGMHFSDHVLEPAIRLALHEATCLIVRPAIDALFCDHRIVSASAVVKSPGGGNSMAWHCDPSITDERRFVSASVWIPLVDVSGENGSLEVLRGGHVGAPPDRGGLDVLTDTYPPHAEVVERCLRAGGTPSGPLRVRVGASVVYDHRLPHRSGPNPGPGARAALNVAVVPREAPLLAHLWVDENQVEAFAVPDGYFATQPLDRRRSQWAETSPVATHRRGAIRST